MGYTDANLSPARFQWEANSAPGQAYNCGPTCVTKMAQYYRDTWYGIEATRRLAVSADYRGTSATEQGVMLARRGVANSVMSINSVAQLHSLTDTGRRPVLIGMYFARVPYAYADHPFRGWHAVCVSRGAVGGFWINDPNFSPSGGTRPDPDRGHKFYPDWVIQQALINNSPRFAVVPTYLKAITVPTPAPTGGGRCHVATPSGLNVCNIRSAPNGAIFARARSDGYTYRVSDGRRLWGNGSQYVFLGWVNGDWAKCRTGSGQILYIHRSVVIIDRLGLARGAVLHELDNLPIEPEALEAMQLDLREFELVSESEAAGFIIDEPVPTLEEQEAMSMQLTVSELSDPWSGRDLSKPGEVCDASGIYASSIGGTEIALSRGDRFPPTRAGAGWFLVRPTEKLPEEQQQEE